MFGFLKKLVGGGNRVNLEEIIQSDVFLIDVRTPSEFQSGSVNGAVNIPLSSLDNQIKKCQNKTNIIVFCRSGIRSAQAKRILEKHGIQNVFNGGSWQNVNYICQKINQSEKNNSK